MVLLSRSPEPQARAASGCWRTEIRNRIDATSKALSGPRRFRTGAILLGVSLVGPKVIAAGLA